jgi:uncharacterized protein
MHTRASNRLASETSPYLQQHAGNPVDWYPWGDEALERARAEDKPILLSIGYSACHWCHVMAHESFEDEATAAVMNRLFVNIKVDREERPDLDKIYQLAQQVLTQRSGGWPLTVFLTPKDRMPFYAGTYFPKEARHGLPSFRTVLERIAEVYRAQRSDIESQNRSMANVLAQIYGHRPAGVLDPDTLTTAISQSEQVFDAREGGFGHAPKFPHTPQLEYLLQHSNEHKEFPQARDMLRFTLEKMAGGGIFDHLGGGFCRYSVDEHWMIPHFEKMLYDNGPLLALYAQAAIAFDDPEFRETAQATASWVMREMQSPEGGYYSSVDADSEGEEGKFYVWRTEEAKQLLDDREYRAFARRFGLDRKPNFETHWHLHVYEKVADLAREFSMSETEMRALLDAAKYKLFTVRERRIRPGRDDKILTSWNALMIRGMAIAARCLDQPAYQASAERATDFLRGVLWKDGRLLATYKDGKAHLAAYLDDYAFLIDAMLELLQTRWRSADLEFAIALAETMLTHFQDVDAGGFYFTADDHPALIERPRSFSDESLPAGNAIAARVLQRLGWLLAESRYLDAAERAIAAAAVVATESPLAHFSLLSAYSEQLRPPKLVVLRGESADLGHTANLAGTAEISGLLRFAIPNEASGLPSALAEKKAMHEPVAYICTGMTCAPPVIGKKAIAEQLTGGASVTADRDQP